MRGYAVRGCGTCHVDVDVDLVGRRRWRARGRRRRIERRRIGRQRQPARYGARWRLGQRWQTRGRRHDRCVRRCARRRRGGRAALHRAAEANVEITRRAAEVARARSHNEAAARPVALERLVLRCAHLEPMAVGAEPRRCLRRRRLLCLQCVGRRLGLRDRRWRRRPGRRWRRCRGLLRGQRRGLGGGDGDVERGATVRAGGGHLGCRVRERQAQGQLGAALRTLEEEGARCAERTGGGRAERCAERWLLCRRRRLLGRRRLASAVASGPRWPLACALCAAPARVRDVLAAAGIAPDERLLLLIGDKGQAVPHMRVRFPGRLEVAAPLDLILETAAAAARARTPLT